jgi:hypothetical protein
MITSGPEISSLPPVKGVGIDDLRVSNGTAEPRHHSRQKQVSHLFHILPLIPSRVHRQIELIELEDIPGNLIIQPGHCANFPPPNGKLQAAEAKIPHPETDEYWHAFR